MRTNARALLAALSIVVSIPAQAPLAPIGGFEEDVVFEDFSSPWGITGFAIGLAPTDLYVTKDNEVRRVTSPLSHVVVHALPPGHHIGLITATPDRSQLLFTDFTSATLYHHDIVTASTTSRPLPGNSFDLAVAPNGDVLVNANPNWPQPGAATGVWLVDPAGGVAHRELVQLSGPSGPIAFDAQGNLWAGILPDIVPPAPGSVRAVRIDAAAIDAAHAGGPSLDESDASHVIAGLDGAYDFEFDARGRLYVTDVNNRTVLRSTPGATAFEATPFCGPGVDYCTRLQFVEIGAASFDAFQPENGGTMFVSGYELAVRSAVHGVTAARPALACSTGATIPIGAFSLDAEGLPASSSAVLCVGLAGLTTETVVLTLDQRPLWFGIDPTMPVFTAPFTADASGTASLPFSHASGAFALTVQAIAFDATGVPALVSSNSQHLTFLP